MSRRRILIAGLLLVTFEIRHECGWPICRIGEVSGVSVGTVHAELAATVRAGGKAGSEVDFAWVHEQSRGKGVTLKLLWTEVGLKSTTEFCNEGYRHTYQYFYRCYKAWAKDGWRTMRQRHDPGDTVFVDFAGMIIHIDARKAQFFVAAFGLSHYAYAEAVWT